MSNADHSPIPAEKKRWFVNTFIGSLGGILFLAFSFLVLSDTVVVPIAWQVGAASGLGVLALVAAYLELAIRRRRKVRAGNLLLVLGQSTANSLLWTTVWSLLPLAIWVPFFHYWKSLSFLLFWPIVQLGMVPYAIIQERDPFEARESGIWHAGELTCWNDIDSYQWDGSILVITLKLPRSLTPRWKIRVADQEAAGQVLDRYLLTGQQQEMIPGKQYGP